MLFESAVGVGFFWFVLDQALMRLFLLLVAEAWCVDAAVRNSLTPKSHTFIIYLHLAVSLRILKRKHTFTLRLVSLA